MKTPLIQNERFVQIAAPLLVGVLVLLMWQLTVVAFDVPKYIVPSPVDIGQSLVSDFSPLFNALLMTLKVTFLAFVIAVVMGVAASLLFVQSKWIEISLFPYAVPMQVTPIVPIISNTTLGLRSVDPNLLSMFRMYRTSRWQELVRLRIPSALPYFFGGLRISSGLALIGAVVAEFVAGTGGAKAGLAYMILQSGYNLQIPKMFAALILITVTGILLFALMVWMSDRALRNWHESALKVEH